ncbi:MAG: fimbria major subunit, partial [Mucinivorans sp.]
TKAASTANVLFVSKMQPEDVTKAATSSAPKAININVERAVAKVVVRGNADFNLGLAASVGADKQTFALNGKATKSYLYQHVDASLLPVNSATTAWDWKSTGATVATGDWKAMTTKTASLKDIKGDGTNGGVYTLESVAGSTSANKASTQVMVKVDILPTANYTTAANGVGAAIADDDNYTVVKHKTIAKSYLFFNQDDFATWKTNNAEEAKKYESTGVKYTKGINYYLVKIVHDATIPSLKFSVLRNYIYDITLGNINGFGSNDTGTIVDPDEQIEVDAYINATIAVLAWNVKEQTSDLE